MKVQNFESESPEKEYKNLEKKDAERLKQVGMKKRKFSLVVIVLVILALSIANMFSVSLGLKSNQLFILKKHIVMITVGLFFMFIASKIPYRLYEKKLFKLSLLLIPIFTFLFMFLAPETLVPFRNGAKAWLQFSGFAIQPAEVFKVTYIIFLAATLAKIEEDETAKTVAILFSVFLIFSLYAIFIYLQNDLGSIIHYALITMYLIILTKIPNKFLIKCGILLTILGIISLLTIYYIGPDSLSGYKLQRIYSFLEGLFRDNYSDEFGYQVRQALNGFGNGGVIGKGFGNGIQKYSYVPETATDFITVTFGEEFGFVGMFILICFYFLLYQILVNISLLTQDTFGKYLSAGIAAYLITQVFINISVAIGLLPVFGLTLPLFSNGGSSIMAILCALGIALNVNDNSA